MSEYLERNIALIGERGQEILKSSRVLIFGLGGVGASATEAIARAGIGKIGILDFDLYEKSNLNRQIFATKNSIGKKKTEIAKKRIEDISDAKVEVYDFYFDDSSSSNINFLEYDFLIDAIDAPASKLEIYKSANSYKKKLISCMGTGNKLDPTKFKFAKLGDTTTCPLARRMRKLAANYLDTTVLYSDEKPKKSEKTYPGTISYMPQIAGLMLAYYCIYQLLEGD